jgi:hypothetical protein
MSTAVQPSATGWIGLAAAIALELAAAPTSAQAASELTDLDKGVPQVCTVDMGGFVNNAAYVMVVTKDGAYRICWNPSGGISNPAQPSFNPPWYVKRHDFLALQQMGDATPGSTKKCIFGFFSDGAEYFCWQ